jgi:hypothetical protein
MAKPPVPAPTMTKVLFIYYYLGIIKKIHTDLPWFSGFDALFSSFLQLSINEVGAR